MTHSTSSRPPPPRPAGTPGPSLSCGWTTCSTPSTSSARSWSAARSPRTWAAAFTGRTGTARERFTVLQHVADQRSAARATRKYRVVVGALGGVVVARSGRHPAVAEALGAGTARTGYPSKVASGTPRTPTSATNTAPARGSSPGANPSREVVTNNVSYAGPPKATEVT